MSPIVAAVDRAVPVAAPVATESHCERAEAELRIQEELLEAEAVLADANWRWVRKLAEAMHDDAMQIQSKLFFLRLLRASDCAAVDAVLSEMETWRNALGGMKKLAREEREGVQALFLLGVDKQMSLAQCP